MSSIQAYFLVHFVLTGIMKYDEALKKNKPLRDHLNQQPVECKNGNLLAANATYFLVRLIQGISRNLVIMEAMSFVKLLEESHGCDIRSTTRVCTENILKD